MKNKVIINAPHLKYPLRNGADIYIDRLGCNLSFFRGRVIIIGANTIVQYEMGSMIKNNSFPNDLRTKECAALRTLMFRSHYLYEKYLTPAYCRKARELYEENPEALIIYSLISTAKLKLVKKSAIIITHNDEIAWFQDQIRFSNNPLQKLTAHISEKWLMKFLKDIANDFIFIHITENDYERYRHLIPAHVGFVVPAGVDISLLPDVFQPDGIIRLLFVGSLGVKMNYDALEYFGKRFWPVLKNVFRAQIELLVLGSQPSNQMRKLCQRENWQLLPDVSDEELRIQYSRADFSILPYSYTNGAKLKLLSSLAAGLPVLATTNMCILPRQDFPPNLYSDKPQEWCNHLLKFKACGISPQQRISCQQFASQYTWREIAAGMNNKITQLGIL